MASRIILDPETLLAQAGEMQSLTAEYESLFSKVTGTLNDTNKMCIRDRHRSGSCNARRNDGNGSYRKSWMWKERNASQNRTDGTGSEWQYTFILPGLREKISG